MTTYYDVLKISPSTSLAEVEKKIDDEYNHWRRLVTHHDLEIADQANKALRQLEQIRATLTDATERQRYDDSIGFQGSLGGLADPDIVAPKSSMDKALRVSKVSVQPTSLDVWICKKCEAPNRIGLKFCARCGRQIGQECPNCQKMISMREAFCAHCGKNIGDFVREQELEDAALKKRQLDEQRKLLENQTQRRAKEITRQRQKDVLRFAFFVVIGIAVLSVFLSRENEKRNLEIALQGYIQDLASQSSFIGEKSITEYRSLDALIERFEISQDGYLTVYFSAEGVDIFKPGPSGPCLKSDGFSEFYEELVLTVDQVAVGRLNSNDFLEGYAVFDLFYRNKGVPERSRLQSGNSYYINYHCDWSEVYLFTAP
jgi:hypothetical protein